MGALDSVKEFYYKLEDKYYDILDSLDAKGVPVYKIVDPIEAAGFPSFPIVSLLLLIILFGAIYFAGSAFFPQVSNVEFAVQDKEGRAIEGASIVVSVAEETFGPKFTLSNGKVKFEKLPKDKEISLEVTKSDYKQFTETFVPGEDEVTRSVVLEELATTI